MSESKKKVVESKYICWRSNPQLQNGGYVTVYDKKPDTPIYGGIDVIAKLDTLEYQNLFPNGVSKLTYDDIVNTIKDDRFEKERASWTDIIGEDKVKIINDAIQTIIDTDIADEDDKEYLGLITSELNAEADRGSTTNVRNSIGLAQFLSDLIYEINVMVDHSDIDDEVKDKIEDCISKIHGISREISK